MLSMWHIADGHRLYACGTWDDNKSLIKSYKKKKLIKSYSKRIYFIHTSLIQFATDIQSQTHVSSRLDRLSCVRGVGGGVNVRSGSSILRIKGTCTVSRGPKTPKTPSEGGKRIFRIDLPKASLFIEKKRGGGGGWPSAPPLGSGPATRFTYCGKVSTI